MFTINKKRNKDQNTQFIELFNSSNSCFAKIDLQLGGSLQELRLDKKSLISSNHVLPYPESYASAVLFPFVNRIEQGRYSFDSNNYELDINEKVLNNALHGLVYNKTFELVSKDSTSTSASVSISYIEINRNKGFPFTFEISLTYRLTNSTLELQVDILNTDENVFPFSLGWHPYFNTSNIFNSYLSFLSHKKLVVNENMIPISEENIAIQHPIQIKDKCFDDCFVLNSNKVKLETPDYTMELSSTSEENYLQLYTPNNRKSIAIEPQTAPANSFNSKIGLLQLQPNETFSLNWKIKID
ncbi:aldose 1-epimerase [Geojedonia litorea]|uniref:Aldose 1-epimerase n=1 Tax=Geojedonia litorea TaxID=1268269 RepID=A0ABV9N9K9_9FLAO